MLKEATPRKKKSTPPKAYKNTPYVRFTGKMLYLNGNTMHMLGCCDSISICVDKASRIMVIRPDGPFRLSRVCETPGARRIETNGSLLAVIEAGFPVGMLGKHIACEPMLGGGVWASLIPRYEGEKNRTGA